ncbi:MAG: hypothetical protein ABW185_10305 [Sedimenticola sp.]
MPHLGHHLGDTQQAEEEDQKEGWSGKEMERENWNASSFSEAHIACGGRNRRHDTLVLLALHVHE